MSITDYEFDRYEKLGEYKRKWKLTSNEYRIEGNTVYVKLNSKTKTSIMLCDLDDWERLKEYAWHCGKSGGYAATNMTINHKHKIVKFHQIVMGQKKGYLVDHINRNPLDNRKENLRFVTHTANLVNSKTPATSTSGYKGVSWRKDSNKWRAHISISGKTINLGCYEKLEDAVEARKRAEEKYFNPLFNMGAE